MFHIQLRNIDNVTPCSNCPYQYNWNWIQWEYLFSQGDDEHDHVWWWVLRWLLCPIGALKGLSHLGQGCSCCLGGGGLECFLALLLLLNGSVDALLFIPWHRSKLCCARLGCLMLFLTKHYGKCRNVLEVFSVSLKHFFWPPLERFPAQSSPYRSCFGRHSWGILTTCLVHLSCDLISMACMLCIPDCSSTSASGM